MTCTDFYGGGVHSCLYLLAFGVKLHETAADTCIKCEVNRSNTTLQIHGQHMGLTLRFSAIKSVKASKFCIS